MGKPEDKPRHSSTVQSCESELHYAVVLSCGHTLERSRPQKKGSTIHCGVCAFNAGEDYQGLNNA